MVIGLGILSEALVSERSHPTRVRIPDLRGHDLAAVADTLDPEIYELDVTYVSSDSHQGRVLKQAPTAGRIVKPRDGESVTLRLTVACRTLPPTMPDLRRMTLEEVLALLAAYDCEVTVVTKSDAYVPEGEILFTLPAAGEKTTHSLTVYVSAGYQQDE